jgi:hypothetical protein
LARSGRWHLPIVLHPERSEGKGTNALFGNPPPPTSPHAGRASGAAPE